MCVRFHRDGIERHLPGGLQSFSACAALPKVEVDLVELGVAMSRASDQASAALSGTFFEPGVHGGIADARWACP